MTCWKCGFPCLCGAHSGVLVIWNPAQQRYDHIFYGRDGKEWQRLHRFGGQWWKESVA